MKKIFKLFFALALVLTLMPLHSAVQAEETGKLVADYEYKYTGKKEGSFLILTAKLPGKDVKGTWNLRATTYKGDESLASLPAKGPELKHQLSLYDVVWAKEACDYRIEFVGEVDGKKTTVSTKVSTGTIKLDHKSVKSEEKYSAKVTTAKAPKNVEGNWMTVVVDASSNKVIDSKKVSSKSLTFEHAFKNLKPGKKYIIRFYFYGEIDGKYEVIHKAVYLNGKDSKATGTTKEENKKTGTTTPTKGDEEKQQPAAKTPETKKATEKSGSELPKTATNYPIVAIAGAGVLVAGLAVLLFVKFRRARS